MLGDQYDKTVLLADDDHNIRELTADMLNCLGYRTITCSNGLELVSYYKIYQDEIDLIFLDLVMPVMNGYECLKELRKLGANIPIVLCSGYPKHRDISRAIRAGANSFVEKPFELKKLASVVHQGLQS